MSTSNKILTGIFVILIVVFLVEVGAYFVAPILKKQSVNKVSVTQPKEIANITGDLANPDQIRYLAALNKIEAFNGRSNVYYSFVVRGVVKDLKKVNENSVKFSLAEENDPEKIFDDGTIFPIPFEGIKVDVYRTRGKLLIPTELSILQNDDLIELSYVYDIEKGPDKGVVKNQLIIYEK